MTIDVILDIKKAEEEAERIIKASSDEARALLADAETKAAQLIEAAQSEAGATAAQMLLNAEQQAAAEIEKMNRRVLAECDHITKNARARFEEAAAIIAGRIINTNVDR
jgi:vacuolar-type H+-ATPase subunit H